MGVGGGGEGGGGVAGGGDRGGGGGECGLYGHPYHKGLKVYKD